MSQKSSFPHPTDSVQYVLTPDTQRSKRGWEILQLTDGHEHYPKINPNTVGLHVEGMSVNSTRRVHHPNIKAGTNWDLFFRLGPNNYRLWDPEHDPQPSLSTGTICLPP